MLSGDCISGSTLKKLSSLLFILYSLQLKIVNFLYKNYRKTECYRICFVDSTNYYLAELL